MRLVLGLLAAAIALAVLSVALVLLLIGVLWALVRGRSLMPWGQRAPVFVGRVFRHTTGRVWRGGGAPGDRAAHSDSAVVDVEVREVSEGAGRSDPTGGDVWPDAPGQSSADDGVSRLR